MLTELKSLAKPLGLILLAPIGGLVAVYLIAHFGVKAIGEWGRWPTFLGGLIAGLVSQVITKYRDVCGVDGLSKIQRDNLTAIVRKRTSRFWLVFYFLVSEFLLGFAIAPLSNSEIGYWVAALWIVGFLYTLVTLLLIKGWLNEVEEFKLKVAQQALDEDERNKLLDDLHKGLNEKVEPKAEFESYNRPFKPTASGKQGK